MCDIYCLLLESRIGNLIKKRDDALRRKDYKRVWMLTMKINKNISRLSRNSYWKIWV